jgi:predicted TIM-barrel fold metal-dependent hydrolase
MKKRESENLVSSSAAAGQPHDSTADSGHSRRKFLQLLAIAGAGAMFPTELLRSQARATAKGRIDVHHHLLPPFYLKARERELSEGGRPLPEWSPQISLDAMDRSGIATAILSPHYRVVSDSLNDKSERARTLARQHNEYAARLMTDHPDRFGVFAALPLPDQDAALNEIAYAFDTLKVDGIGLWTSYQDKWPGDPAFAPVFDELNRRKAVVFFHPAAPTCCRSLVPGVGPNVVEYDFDTTRTFVSLLANDVFTRCPDIRFIFSHSGATIPVLANRISETVTTKSPARTTPEGVREEFTKVYYEVAHAGYGPPLAALTKLVSTARMLFGSDFPVYEFPVTTDPLDRFGFSASELQAINRGNAEQLFPRLRA